VTTTSSLPPSVAFTISVIRFEFENMTFSLEIGQKYPRRQLLESLVSLFYTRS
jgi:excinuclease UvrABC helicase subunit UvrB